MRIQIQHEHHRCQNSTATKEQRGSCCDGVIRNLDHLHHARKNYPLLTVSVTLDADARSNDAKHPAANRPIVAATTVPFSVTWKRPRVISYLTSPRIEGARLRRPILLVDDGQDTLFPCDSVEDLYVAAGEPKEFWIVPEARHGKAWETKPEEYKRRVLAFWREALGSSELELLESK
jgi:pimeloyl-ACP methyl ester carboxylesterase